MKNLKVGDRVYMSGDRCNASGFGTISDVIADKFALRYNIKMDDGRKVNGIYHSCFSDVCSGYCGEFVTEQAYINHRNEIIGNIKVA